jgi:putative glutamine amidotransferase
MMRKLLIIILVLVYLIKIDAQPKSCKRIGLINPTIWNIENIVFLFENGYIQTDSFHIIGILHESQKDLLKTSKQYVDEHGYTYISFEFISSELSIDSLFIKNNCYSDFLKIFNETDALLFLGGADISPRIYGESTFLTTALMPAEQNWEISFLYHLIGGFQNDAYLPILEQKPDYLILGICLGMQEMNVASGGSLYQDIPFQIYGLKNYDEIVTLPTDNQHKNYWPRIDNTHADLTGISFHQLDIVKNSYLNTVSSTRFPLVASAHHQSVKRLGRNFKISATSMDKKVIEAFSHNQFKNVYGIQFHNDYSMLFNDNANFKISPNKIIQLNNIDRQFYINFWMDFSNRLNTQQ